MAGAGIAVIVCACSSVPDITYWDGTSGSSSGGSSGTSSGDGAPDVVSDCKSTGPEICDDGIDNDCDGKIDCADSECTPVTECVDPAPAGWTLIAYAASTRPPCTTGFDTPTDFKTVTGTGTGNCTCACNVSTGTACNADNLAVAVDDNSCANAAVNLATNANCTNITNPITVPNQNAAAKVTPPAGPTGCTGATTIAAGSIESGRTCSLANATKLGKGCSGANQVCAPKPTGFSVCVMKPGEQPCPDPYTKVNTVGATANDLRSCNACSCEPKGCAGTVELFEDVNCTVGAGKKSTLAIDGTCDLLGTSNRNFTAVRYKTTMPGPANGCGLVSNFDGTLSGNVEWTDQRTVCCK